MPNSPVARVPRSALAHKEKSEPTGLYSEETSRYLPLRQKKSPLFVVFLLITALCNIRKHTGTPKVLLKPASFFLVICLEVKKKTEVETTDNKATNKNRVSVLS